VKTNVATYGQRSSNAFSGLGREVFTKLRFESRSKKFGNHWYKDYFMIGQA